MFDLDHLTYSCSLIANLYSSPSVIKAKLWYRHWLFQVTRICVVSHCFGVISVFKSCLK